MHPTTGAVTTPAPETTTTIDEALEWADEKTAIDRFWAELPLRFAELRRDRP